MYTTISERKLDTVVYGRKISVGNISVCRRGNKGQTVKGKTFEKNRMTHDRIRHGYTKGEKQLFFLFRRSLLFYFLSLSLIYGSLSRV